MKKTPIERLREEIEHETVILVTTKILEVAWQSFTSRRHDSWTSANPAMGQSDVTALFLAEQLGGEIRKAEVSGHGWYYYNVLPDGRRLDPTRSKFPDGMALPEGQPIALAELMASEDARGNYLAERFSLLVDRVEYVRKALDRTPPKHKTSRPPRRKTPT